MTCCCFQLLGACTGPIPHSKTRWWTHLAPWCHVSTLGICFARHNVHTNQMCFGCNFKNSRLAIHLFLIACILINTLWPVGWLSEWSWKLFLPQLVSSFLAKWVDNANTVGKNNPFIHLLIHSAPTELLPQEMCYIRFYEPTNQQNGKWKIDHFLRNISNMYGL